MQPCAGTVPHGPLAHPQSMKSQWGGRPCPPYKTAQVENLCHRKNFSGQFLMDLSAHPQNMKRYVADYGH